MKNVEIIGDTNLEIIQGDTFPLAFTLDEIDLDSIEHLYFTCETLGIKKEFTRNENDGFELEIHWSETRNFQVVKCCYDITICFVGDTRLTPLYRGELTVLKKVNPID